MNSNNNGSGNLGEDNSSLSQDPAQTITITIMEPSSALGDTVNTSSVSVSNLNSSNLNSVVSSGSGITQEEATSAVISEKPEHILQTSISKTQLEEEFPVISNISNPEEEEILGQEVIKESEIYDEEVDIAASSDPHCLVCNKELPQNTDDTPVAIFQVQTTATQRKMSVMLGVLVGQKITSRKSHSDLLCSRCYNLLDKVDSLEIELQDTKDDLINNYQSTYAIYGGRPRRKKAATAKKKEFVFPKIEPDEIEREDSLEFDSNFEPRAEDLLEEEADQQEDLVASGALDDEWEPEFKKPKLKRENTDADGGVAPKRRRGRPRKDITKAKEYGVPLEGDHEVMGQGNSIEVHIQDINGDLEKQDFSDYIFKRDHGKRIIKEKYSKEGDYIVNQPRQQYYRLNPQKFVCMSEPLSCSECGEIFESEPLYKMHCIEAHTEQTGFHCQHCPLIFDKRHEFDSHLINHTPINHVCEMCSVGFPSAALLIKHLQEIHPDSANTCSKCKATFINKEQLNYHIDQKHRRGRRKKDDVVVDLPGSSVVCSECGKVCSTMMAYQSHKYNEHIHLYPHECRVCCRRFSRLEYLDTHLKTHINGSIVCQKCSVKFSNASHLVDHMYYVHGQKKALVCAICQRYFSSPSSLKIHQNMEHREGLVCKEICKVCGEKYPTAFTLKRHMMTHKREHQCKYCGKKMSTKASLEVHINMIHTKEQSYLCPHCQREFFVKHLLQMHIKRVHSDRRDFQYKCNICNKSYLQEWELILHNKTHTNERNFKCDVCGEAFYTISRMRYHRATHKTTRDSECPVCNQMFRRDVDTKNHLRRVHKVINPGHFIELCARFGKDKAQELHQMEVISEHESGLDVKESRVVVEDVIVDKDPLEIVGSSTEHITLYRMEDESEEQPVQVIIPDSMEMMVLEDTGVNPQNPKPDTFQNQSQLNLSHEDVAYVYVNDNEKHDDSIKHEQQIISIIQIDDFPD